MRAQFQIALSSVLILGVLIASCADSGPTRVDKDWLIKAHSTEQDCPECDTLTNDDWDNLKEQIDLLETTSTNQSCINILDSLQSYGKDDFGRATASARDWTYGVHDTRGHFVAYDYPHIGLAEEYFDGTWGMGGGSGALVTAFHESAHHLGWKDHERKGGLDGAYGAEGQCEIAW